jgi:hypothetical protein
MPQENLIQRGDLLQRLTRGLEIKGVKSPALLLETTVVPVVLLEDLAKGGFEDPRAPGWFFSERPAAVAGQLSGFAVNNNSQGIVVVDRVALLAGASLDFDVYTTTTAGADALTTILPVSWGDTRRPGVPPFSGNIGSTVAGVTPIQNVIAKFRWASGASQTEILVDNPVLLDSGKALVVQCFTANSAFQVVASGRFILEA